MDGMGLWRAVLRRRLRYGYITRHEIKFFPLPLFFLLTGGGEGSRIQEWVASRGVIVLGRLGGSEGLPMRKQEDES